MTDAAPTDLAAAADPATSPASLHRLARHRHRDVRRAVARNANTALTDLDHLCMVFADDVAQNPLLDWLALEDADWLVTLGERPRHRLLQSARCPVGLLWWAARFGTVDDRLAVASNAGAPSVVIDALADGNDEAAVAAQAHVRRSGASTRVLPDPFGTAAFSLGERDRTQEDIADLVALDAVPAWMTPVLALSDDLELTRALAANAHTPAPVLEQLMVHPDEATSQLAIANPALAGARLTLWSRLCTYDPSLGADELAVFDAVERAQQWIVRHPNAPAAAVERCLASTDWRLREAAAAHPGLTRAQALVLAEDSDRDVRAAVARHAVLPREVVQVLRLDGDDLVSRAASDRLREGPAHGDASMGERLLDPGDVGGADGPPAIVRRADALTRMRPGEEWLRAASTDVDPAVRVALAHNPATPVDTMAALAGDEIAAVRAAVAGSTRDAALCERLAWDLEPSVRMATARNPATPPSAVRVLTVTDHEGIRAALLGRGDPSIVALLVGLDPDDPALEALVTLLAGGEVTSNVSAEAWDREWIAQKLADAPSTAASALGRLSESSAWRVRQSVARHRRAPDTALRRLARDTDSDVRAAVAANPATPDDVTVELVEDTDEKVRMALLRRVTLAPETRDRLMRSTADAAASAQLMRHADTAERELRQALHARVPLPAAALQTFATGGLRLLAAANPGMTEAMLAPLATDTSWQVREQVAANPRTGTDVLAALATDHDRDVRAAVAANSTTAAALVAVLLSDSDSLVRRRARTHPSIGDAERARHRALVVARIARGPGPLAQAIALQVEDVDRAELRRRRHHRSIHWLVRACAAAHPQLDAAVRARLANDAHRIVRAVARGDRSLPSGSLHEAAANVEVARPGRSGSPEDGPIAFVGAAEATLHMVGRDR